MSDLNYVSLTGRITRDSEIRRTTSGKAITTFSIATNDDYKKGEEWVKRAYFFNVAFQGEKQLAKGTPILLQGKITARQNEGRMYFTIAATKIMPLSKPEKKEVKREDEFSFSELAEQKRQEKKEEDDVEILPF